MKALILWLQGQFGLQRLAHTRLVDWRSWGIEPPTVKAEVDPLDLRGPTPVNLYFDGSVSFCLANVAPDIFSRTQCFQSPCLKTTESRKGHGQNKRNWTWEKERCTLWARTKVSFIFLPSFDSSLRRKHLRRLVTNERWFWEVPSIDHLTLCFLLSGDSRTLQLCFRLSRFDLNSAADLEPDLGLLLSRHSEESYISHCPSTFSFFKFSLPLSPSLARCCSWTPL